MESLLATVLLAVPLTAWLSRTILQDDWQVKLARSSNALREFFPTSRNFNSPATPKWSGWTR
ncbi:MAG: hypothetical protein AUI12_03525 [Acidobacteria bacterium 13_2_20CM_2_57_6]|nr:MAG: hypothetical protein AUH16_10095 [Acidobacteria bacterium 13_2_20CM_57_7]OLB88948.1 MAG: hypothetical protein AUI12_03525 [Acidobacteria bacterium 13_2_20CM_2_57_6]PYT38975.1 MAG: hypothetical protein DMG45_21465 [Acidobacteriota bacterium]PYT44578.1 MAG: hypothetical protein DMG47_10630 [Acidobacteriota bacterium]PYT57381.1 MAG: hypothetical protein DMG46_14475 [Acidobacteriota bacterium]